MHDAFHSSADELASIALSTHHMLQQVHRTILIRFFEVLRHSCRSEVDIEVAILLILPCLLCRRQFSFALDLIVDGLDINPLLSQPSTPLLHLLAAKLIGRVLILEQSGKLAHVLGLGPVLIRLVGSHMPQQLEISVEAIGCSCPCLH